MSHLAYSPTSGGNRVSWPDLYFGPVNLWSLHPAWKRDGLEPKIPAPPIGAHIAQTNPAHAKVRSLLALR